MIATENYRNYFLCYVHIIWYMYYFYYCKIVWINNTESESLEIWDRDAIPDSCNWSQEIFILHVPIDSSTSYTVRLHYQTSTLMPACQAGRQFVPFLWWFSVWLDWGVNLQHPAWDVDTLTTKPSQCNQSIQKGSLMLQIHNVTLWNHSCVSLWKSHDAIFSVEAWLSIFS